jgi:hypothetical protein
MAGFIWGDEPARCALFAPALPDFDIKPLDLLIQCRQRDPELFRGVGLVPVAALQLFNNKYRVDET